MSKLFLKLRLNSFVGNNSENFINVIIIFREQCICYQNDNKRLPLASTERHDQFTCLFEILNASWSNYQLEFRRIDDKILGLILLEHIVLFFDKFVDCIKPWVFFNLFL